MDYSLKICHIYPDVLNLYGDTGNILALQYRLKQRGISVSVDKLMVNDKLENTDYDIYFIGGGQDFEQDVLLKDASVNKSSAIKDAIESNKVFLAICGGYQVLGKYYKTWDNKRMDFIGALDVYTIGNKDRMIGNFMYELIDHPGNRIVGFENHSGKTYLGDSVKPLGKIIYGKGNNGEDGYEGARYKNVFATYSHGPLLPKNPYFCDLLLETALKNKYGLEFKLSELDDTFENRAHQYIESRLSK